MKLKHLLQHTNRSVSCLFSTNQNIVHSTEIVSLLTYEYDSLDVKEKVCLNCTPLMPVLQCYNTAQKTRNTFTPSSGEK